MMKRMRWRRCMPVLLFALLSCRHHERRRSAPESPVGRPRLLELKGSHEEMGRQHGSAVSDLRAKIMGVVQARFERARELGRDAEFDAALKATHQLLEREFPQFLQLIRGQAEALGVAYQRLVDYNLMTFLMQDLLNRKERKDERVEGCSTFAATGSATRAQKTLLVKNRDYDSRYLDLQVVASAQPRGGIPYLAVTSAGAAGVFSGGINEKGLACVDTYVSSTDVGVGFPNSALMMYILERCSTVEEALAFLERVRRMGRNTISMADARGSIALSEIGNEQLAVERKADGFLVATNHFQSAEMRHRYRPQESPAERGSSQARAKQLSAMLAASHGSIDVALAKRIMAYHGPPTPGAGPALPPPSSLCRHNTAANREGSETVSEMIFDTRARTMHLAHGHPCQGSFNEFGFGR